VPELLKHFVDAFVAQADASQTDTAQYDALGC